MLAPKDLEGGAGQLELLPDALEAVRLDVAAGVEVRLVGVLNGDGDVPRRPPLSVGPIFWLGKKRHFLWDVEC